MRTVLAILLVFVVPGLVHADEEGSAAARPARPSAVNPASNASFDKRLPPVLPGETLKSGDGTEIKVWSTAGSVAGGEAPPAPPGATPVVGSIGVIVDHRYDREDESRRRGRGPAEDSRPARRDHR